nr:hypothetical protein [Tanacetum cinerariifolium]
MPRECLAIIESKSKVCYSRNKPVVSKAPAYQALAPQTQGVSKEDFSAYVKANDAVMKNMQTQGQNIQNQLTNLIDLITKFMKSNSASTSSLGTLPRNMIANSKSDLKAITTRSGVSYDGPQIPPPPSSLPKAVQFESPVSTSKPVTSLISEPVITLAPAYQALAPQTQGVSKEDFPAYVKANDAVMKNMQTQGQNMQNQLTNLIDLITKFMKSNSAATSSLGTLPRNTIANSKSDLKAITTRSGVSYDGPQIPPPPSSLPKEKLSEMARTSLNEHCSAVLLKKLPEKLGDPGKFLIPCDFPGMAECLALADLGASINLMPFSVWKILSLPDLKPTCMTLELADCSISHPVRVAKDVYVKIDWKSFNRCVQSDMTAKRIDVIDMACKEYSHEVLGFFDTILSGNPTPYYDPIVFATSSTLTPFENSYFLLEEVDAFLAIEDEPTSSEFYQPYLDPERDILL